MSDTTHAHNDQPGHIIERLENGQPTYFSLKVGRDFGQPSGGWTMERSQATVLTEAEARHRLEHGLSNLAPFCKVVTQ
jgi:hypothetical protein